MEESQSTINGAVVQIQEQRSLQNEMIHFMTREKYDVSRHSIIISCLNTFVQTREYNSIISVAIAGNKEKDVISISSIPLIVHILITSLKIITLAKTLKNEDIKFFIFGLLYNYILNDDPQFFNEMSPDALETIFIGIWYILQIPPNLVKIGGVFCC